METVRFEKNSFSKRLRTMLSVDIRRLVRSPLFYILVALCLLMPIVILVMTSMMDGMVTVDQQTQQETVIQGFDNVWQIIGSVSTTTSASASTDAAAMEMDILSMCNINMLYFLLAVLVCSFVSADFRSGYAKNLFAVRSQKTDYIISKTIVLSIGSAFMILAFVIGALLGGMISSLSFAMEGFGILNLVCCILSKVLLVSVFVPIYLVMSVAAKKRLWLSILLSMGVGMFLFMMIPMMTPLNASAMNILLCLAGGAMFSVSIGAISNLVLKKTSLV